MPTSFAAVSFSSRVAKWATSAVKIGVVALRIEARPLAMWVWPQKISVNGSALLRRPSTAKAGPARASGARLSPVTRAKTARIAAAMATRPSAKVSGGKSSTATLAKKNEPPHSTDRKIRSSQSAADIDSFFGMRARVRRESVARCRRLRRPAPPVFRGAVGQDRGRTARLRFANAQAPLTGIP